MRAHPFVLLMIGSVLTACATGRPSCAVETSRVQTRIGSASCALMHEGELLLIRHLYSGKLDLPGGSAKTGETAQCTAHRETWEETGIAVTVHEPLPGLTQVFRCEPVNPEVLRRKPGIPWWSRTEVTGILWRNPSTIRPAEWRYGSGILALQKALGSPPSPPVADSLPPDSK